MSPSNLNPSTFQSLKEDVIGNVMQHVLPTHRRLPDNDNGVNSFQATVTQQTMYGDHFSSKGYSTSSRQSNFLKTPPPPLLRSIKKLPGGNIDGHKRKRTNDNEFLDTVHHETPYEGQRHKLEKVVNEHRLKRIRLNQARYRKKLENRPMELKTKIMQVKEQIEVLESERKQILGGVSIQKGVWDAAVAYMRIFRRGFHAPEGTNIRDIDALNSFIASDVAFSGGIGRQELVNNWRILTKYFPDVYIELKNLKQMTKNSILATTTTSITVSQSSIRNVFPYLLDNIEGLTVSAKMQGQNLVLHGSTRFDWDNTIHRVVNIQTETDTISPLLELLGSLEEVSQVLDGTRCLP